MCNSELCLCEKVKEKKRNHSSHNGIASFCLAHLAQPKMNIATLLWLKFPRMYAQKQNGKWLNAKKSSDDQATSVWNVNNMVKKKICWACKTPKLSGLTNKLWPWLGNRN